MSVALNYSVAPLHVREAIDAAYANGYAAGLVNGRAEAEASEMARWATMSRRIVELGTSPSAAELADRRGEHERADAIRAGHKRRGLAA